MAKKEPKLEFASKTDWRTAKEDFDNLKNHPAWQRIVDYYDRKIAYLESVITGDLKADDGTSMIKTIDQLERFRDRRNMAIQFRNLPDIISGVEDLNSEELDLDPFER